MTDNREFVLPLGEHTLCEICWECVQCGECECASPVILTEDDHLLAVSALDTTLLSARRLRYPQIYEHQLTEVERNAWLPGWDGDGRETA